VSHLKRDLTPAGTPPPQRLAFQGMINTIRFNWEYYLLASGGIGAGIVLAWLPLPVGMRALGLLGLALAVYFLLASLLASFWIYDLAPLYHWEWLPKFLNTPPRCALNLSAGFDEASPTLQRLFATATFLVADFFDPSKHTEASLERARRACPVSVPFTRVASTQLPYASHTFDTIFLLFAAHEIRDPQEREQLFQELRRVLRPDGRIVLVEHLRNWANLAVYGPGALHFFPREEWERLAHQAGFSHITLVPHTPFVAAMRIER
jgi:SAM-dependent methyltransferase